MIGIVSPGMFSAGEGTVKVVKGKKYLIITQWGTKEIQFFGIGAPGSDRQDPVFRSDGLVTSMIPWQAIENKTSLDN